MIPTQSTPAVLGRARELVAPALRSAIANLSPELRPVAEYHLGWVDADGQPVGGDGGKGVRPALALLSAEAAGAPGWIGVPGGVAVELVHNFSLIHDDLIDNDKERRHRPTVWALFGVGRAVIVGDALVALAQQIVLEPIELARAAGLVASAEEAALLDGRRAARVVADATAAMIAGQALDMAFESVPYVDIERCLAMEAGKTGALFGCAASIGAVLAGADEPVVAALDRFGMELGLAFQAVDDLLGIWGDPATTGKPTWSDLRARKKSLPVSAALAGGGGDAEELAVLLSQPELDEPAIARIAHLVEACGGRDLAEAEADRRLKGALGALGDAPLAERPCIELAELANFVVERKY